MNLLPIEIIDWKQWIMAFGLTLPRLLGVLSLLPLASRQIIPGLLRACIAAALCGVMVPFIREQLDLADPSALEYMAIICKESLIGLLLGFLASIPFWAFEAVGFFIDNQRGAAIAGVFSPLSGADSSPLADLLQLAVITFFLVVGGFTLLLSMVYESYVLWPVFDWWPQFNAEMVPLLLAQLDKFMRFMLVFSAPVVLAMFLAELGLALISMFAPQLQVFFLSIPIKSGLAMWLLGLYMGALFIYVNESFLQQSELLSLFEMMTR